MTTTRKISLRKAVQIIEAFFLPEKARFRNSYYNVMSMVSFQSDRPHPINESQLPPLKDCLYTIKMEYRIHK